MNGIKTAVMLSATCEEILCLAFWCSLIQDGFGFFQLVVVFFFSFAECELFFFNAVAKYLS